MELNQLYYFRVAAETQNLTEAAEKLHISQPTLSKVIKRLEDDMGVKLFDRRPARLELNPYGSSFLIYVNQALDALERGQQYMETMKTGENRGLRLISTFLGIASMLTENYVKQHPDVSVIELTETPENVLSMLMGGHADFALTLFPLDHPEVEPVVTTREPLLLLVPESMKAPEGSVCLSDYASARFGIFEGGKDMNATFLRCCSEAHFVPNVVYRATRSQIVHQLVNELEVCTLLPAHMAMKNWGNLPESIRKRVCLISEPKCYRTICLSARRTDDPIKKDFADYARYNIQQMDRNVSNFLQETQF